MPQRSNIVGDLGTTKVASDSYDIDNIYLTEEGWVYRHYKKTDKSKWWDEIIVAGEVPSGDSPQATNPPKLGTVASPTFETGGDSYKDFEYSTQTATGGGVPNFNSGGAPVPPATSIGGVNIDTEPGSMTVGVAANLAASIGGDATVTWQWSKGAGSGNATFSNANAASTTVTVDAADTYTFIAQASSSDAGLTGGSPQSLTSSSIVASNPAVTYTLNLTGAQAGNTAYTAQIDGGAVSDNPTVTLNQGDTLIITNNSGAHPVIITESDGGTSTTDGTITGDNPAGDGGTLTWDTTAAAAGTYYYQCQSHAAMIGTITLNAA